MSSVTTFQKREQIILDHLLQVKSLAVGVHRRCPPTVLLEDLVSAGTLGLLQAVRRFDTRRNLKLKTLAEHRIRGAMIDYLRQLDPLPRAVRRFQRERDAAESEFQAHDPRKPSDDDLAAKLGVPVQKYRQLSQIVSAAAVLSLDNPGGEEQKPLDAASPVSNSPDPLLRTRLRAAIQGLPKQEHAVIGLFLSGLSVAEIAARICLTQGRISQIKSQAISHLRFALGVASGDVALTRR